MIDLTIDPSGLAHAVERARERNIIIPTFAQQKDPSLVPTALRQELSGIGLWDITPRNLFRITWKNDPVAFGGGYGDVNTIEIPPELTGVEARIFALVGKWFPTGAHKVGAAFGCLVPRLVTGQFDPTLQKSVWPSTGNFCRGGAYDAALLACDSIAILPEGMSRERFEWLETVSGEVIATPGTESNVKEIFDKCHELERDRGERIFIFNQFEEFGNYLWHYEITGHAMQEVLARELRPNERFAGVISNTGSGGTIACGDYLKRVYPNSKVVASEALQCPTLLLNGFGSHRIEGIGDKHVPWIHNLRNTDVVTAIDDQATINLIRLFNEPKGRGYLKWRGVPPDFVDMLDLMGISGVANLLGAIKTAKWFELTSRDVLLTVWTDSMELYESRLRELRETEGEYTELNAAADYERYLLGEDISNMAELSYRDRKRVHNLKYFTWVEQQGKSYEEIQAQWHQDDYWTGFQGQIEAIDTLITDFNERTGLLAAALR
jgi:cysteine synthase A